jgi:16S rRNA (cytidine1402-2'-O)-methyltransferase
MLYITSTPIGNLSDTTIRAQEILKAVPLIIAENPNHTRILLNHFGITGKEVVQFAEHNEEKMLPVLIQRLKDTDAALVSDAGTPGISDPGFRLVREAIKEKVNVSPIPGANAAISALCASGLPTDKFIFLGFVPKTEIKLIRDLQKSKDIEATSVFYESPHRIIKTVGYITKEWPEANIVVAREVTKLHEEFIRGSTTEVLEILNSKPSVKGEITVVLSFK